MSKPTQLILHLVLASGVGFQYYFMRHIPGLPCPPFSFLAERWHITC